MRLTVTTDSQITISFCTRDGFSLTPWSRYLLSCILFLYRAMFLRCFVAFVFVENVIKTVDETSCLIYGRVLQDCQLGYERVKCTFQVHLLRLRGTEIFISFCIFSQKKTMKIYSLASLLSQNPILTVILVNKYFWRLLKKM